MLTKAQKEQLAKVIADLAKLQDDYRGKEMPQDVGEKFASLAAEAKAMQDEADREAVIDGAKAFGERANAAAPVPGDKGAGGDARPERKYAGGMTVGDFVAASKGMRDFAARGRPRENMLLAAVPELLKSRHHGRHIIVPLTAEQVTELKAVPTLGDQVILEDRLSEFVRVVEHDRLRLRDVLNVSPTGSDTVRYSRLVNYTRAAATVANSAQKPEAAITLDSVTEAVRTIAVWMPVEEQQLADMPQLGGLINGELLYDVAKRIEELAMYGDGVGEDFLGILKDPDVLACRSESGDTLIDIARRGITDVRRAGYEPNGILADPLDWEGIVLAKGTDDRYVWVVVTENGVQRLWGLPVIETVAMEDAAGVATEERNLLVGDFANGATLWDRQAATVSVGWINDQFIRNQRTLLAELRAAFGVKRPGAFRKHVTQVASSS